MRTIVFDIAISFGPSCRTIYQLDRVLGAATQSSVFSWQLTPRRAQLTYLRRRFAGMFDLDDLAVEGGFVVNRRYGTDHRHEFPDGIAEDQIASHYAQARSRHDYLADKTHRLLRGRQRVLIGLSYKYRWRDFWKLWLALRLAYPLGRFRLLNGPDDPAPGDLSGWRATDAIWDEHLRQVRASGLALNADQ